MSYTAEFSVDIYEQIVEARLRVSLKLSTESHKQKSREYLRNEEIHTSK